MKVYLLIEHGGDSWEDVKSVHATYQSARKKQIALAKPKYKTYRDSYGYEACKKRPSDWKGAWYESEPLHLRNFVGAYFIQEEEVLD